MVDGSFNSNVADVLRVGVVVPDVAEEEGQALLYGRVFSADFFSEKVSSVDAAVELVLAGCNFASVTEVAGMYPHRISGSGTKVAFWAHTWVSAHGGNTVGTDEAVPWWSVLVDSNSKVCRTEKAVALGFVPHPAYWRAFKEFDCSHTHDGAIKYLRYVKDVIATVALGGRMNAVPTTIEAVDTASLVQWVEQRVSVNLAGDETSALEEVCAACFQPSGSRGREFVRMLTIKGERMYQAALANVLRYSPPAVYGAYSSTTCGTSSLDGMLRTVGYAAFLPLSSGKYSYANAMFAVIAALSPNNAMLLAAAMVDGLFGVNPTLKERVVELDRVIAGYKGGAGSAVAYVDTIGDIAAKRQMMMLRCIFCEFITIDPTAIIGHYSGLHALSVTLCDKPTCESYRAVMTKALGDEHFAKH